MKDKDSYFRGACNSCECQEYGYDGGINCADCRCPASRHKLTYWTSPTKKSAALPVKAKGHLLQRINPLNWISFQWLLFLNPFNWIALHWISMRGIRFPMIGFHSEKKPTKENNKYMERIERIPTIISSWLDKYSFSELWIEFIKSIPDLKKIPNIDSSLDVVEKFQKRIPLALAALGTFAVAGILGFRGSHLNFEILDSIYIFTMSILILGAAFSHHIYLSSESAMKRSVAVVLFGLNSFSALVYFLLYLGMTPKLYGPLGIPIQAARFIDWNLSLPCFLEISSLLTTGKPIDRRIDFKVQIFILSLLISSGLLSPLCEVLGGLGIFLIGTILIDVGDQFLSILESKNSDHTTIKYIQSLLFWSLTVIACTWALGLATVFRFPESELFYSLTDAGFKFGFTALGLSLEGMQKSAVA